MTPAERKKLEEELAEIEALKAKEMQELNVSPISESSTALSPAMPPPSALSGWNSDHSIDAGQSPEYQRKRSADEDVEDAKETASQDASLLPSIGSAYEGVGNALVGGAESIFGGMDGGDVTAFVGTGAAALEGGNQVINKYQDGKADANHGKLAEMHKKMGEGKSNPISAMDDFKAKLAKDGIDYEELKKKPGTMREKLTATYNEQLAKKYPSWGSRTVPGWAGGKLSGGGPIRSGMMKAAPTALVAAGAIPAVYGALDSFSKGGDIDDALKELPSLEEKAKQFDLEYKSVQLDFANDWFSKNNPDMHPPGVYEKRLATRALLQAQIDQMK